MTNDTTPAPEGVTPEQVAELTQRLKGRSFFLREAKQEVKSPELMDHAAAMIEALAADLAAQKARADAAEAETNKVRRFLKISRDEGGEALTRAEAAEAKVARLEAAASAVADDVCSYICPSVGREGAPIPHDPRCIALRAALKGEDHE